MSEFYKVLDAKGRSYPASENFTDPYVPALKAMGVEHDQVKWTEWMQQSYKEPKSKQPTQPLSNVYEVCGCFHIDSKKLILSVYKSQSKQTLIKAVKYDKATGRKFASVAKPRKGKR